MPNTILEKTNNFLQTLNQYTKKKSKPVKITQQDLNAKDQTCERKQKELFAEINHLKDIEKNKYAGDALPRPLILQRKKEFAQAEKSYLNLSESFDKQEAKGFLRHFRNR